MAKEKSPKERANERYLHDIFMMVRRRDAFIVAQKNSQFSDTELRMLSEILAAKHKGERLISTELANILGVTRSAISQIVNRLEARGVVKRVADDVDRKIAYIEVTDEAMESYSEDLKNCSLFVGRVVEKFGEENFDKMCDLFEEFTNLIDLERGNAAKSRAGRKSKK
jgi:DNA-binding MarR family transcriptional regulator